MYFISIVGIKFSFLLKMSLVLKCLDSSTKFVRDPSSQDHGYRDNLFMHFTHMFCNVLIQDFIYKHLLQ